jgi:hypothetical protein
MAFELLLVLALAGAALLIALTALYIVLRVKSKQQTEEDEIQVALGVLQQRQQKLENSLQLQFKEFNAQADARLQSVKQQWSSLEQSVQQKLKPLTSELEQLGEQVQYLKSQEPEDKLYSRALKMVSLGADVDELVSECDLPRAEAEMLVAIHHKKS